MATYNELLQHPNWQKKRLEVLNYADWRCQLCGDKDTQLHCHHSYYVKGKKPWQYPSGSIISLCKNCHSKIHGKSEEKPNSGPSEQEAAWNKHREETQITKPLFDYMRENRPLVLTFLYNAKLCKVNGSPGCLVLVFNEDESFAKELVERDHLQFIKEGISKSLGWNVEKLTCFIK